MILRNLTKGTVVSADLKLAEKFTDRLFGLLLKKNPRSLFLKTRFGIHTFFLKEKIDLIIVDNQNVVRKIKTVGPNRIFFYNMKFNKVIELPEGANSRSKTKEGDKLGFVEG